MSVEQDRSAVNRDRAALLWGGSAISDIRPFGTVSVSVRIEQMSCQHISQEDKLPLVGSNTRDEVYLEVRGRKYDAQGNAVELISKRMPGGDDYYEFENNTLRTMSTKWTNKDQRDVGYPLIWSGTLLAGERVDLVVMIEEQDNKDLLQVRSALSWSLDKIGSARPDYKQYTDNLKEVANLLPTTTRDDIIGSFSVTVENVAGKIKATWIALDAASGINTSILRSDPDTWIDTSDSGHTSTGFDMRGTRGSDYDVIPAVAYTVEAFKLENVESKAWIYSNSDGRFGTYRGDDYPD
jgi:hypothetical protein